MPEGTYSTFGKLLKHYRDEEEITRRALAEMLNMVWSESAIEKYERGERSPHGRFVKAVVERLQLDRGQEEALLMAIVADVMIRLRREYEE